MTDKQKSLTERLRALCNDDFSSVYLEFNDHATSYLNAKQASEGEFLIHENDWASKEEKDKAIDTNSVWKLHWYPKVVGRRCGYRVFASSPEACLEVAEQIMLKNLWLLT